MSEEFCQEETNQKWNAHAKLADLGRGPYISPQASIINREPISLNSALTTPSKAVSRQITTIQIFFVQGKLLDCFKFKLAFSYFFLYRLFGMIAN